METCRWNSLKIDLIFFFAAKTSTYLEIFIPIAVLLLIAIIVGFCLYIRKQKQRQQRLENALKEGYKVKGGDNLYLQE
jgi:sensor domain CHASE-containing protein